MELLNDDEVVWEIRRFIEHLEGIHSQLISDHILNLLEEVEGRLPEEKKDMLAVIDHYLALPAEERLIFKVGRRAGIYRRLDDLRNKENRLRVEEAIRRLEEEGAGKAEETMKLMMANYI
jgi:hypothetical protein